MLYFAYGSNMSVKRLCARTPSARPMSVASLQHHELRFHKISHDQSAKCDAVETGRHHDFVIGVVFELSEHEKPALDKAEGLGQGYEQKVIVLTTHEGERLEAFTYYATHIDNALKPYHWYKEHVLRGALEHGLPKFYVETIENVESIDDPLIHRHEQELIIYQ